MRYFDNGNRLNQDDCALEVKDRENQSRTDYLTYNFFHASGPCQEQEQKLREFSSGQPNLNFRIGYGVASSCTIDADTQMRQNAEAMTHGPERRSLCTRSFVASPNLGKGYSIPNLESILINGVDTFIDRECHKLAETQLGVFAPMPTCVQKFVTGASMVLDDDVRIGRPSKDIFLAQKKSSCV